MPEESSCKGKLCILSYLSCHIYRTCRSIYVGWREILKLLNVCVCVCVCGEGGRGGGGAVKPQRDGTIFMEEVDPSRNHVKILIGQL